MMQTLRLPDQKSDALQKSQTWSLLTPALVPQARELIQASEGNLLVIVHPFFFEGWLRSETIEQSMDSYLRMLSRRPHKEFSVPDAVEYYHNYTERLMATINRSNERAVIVFEGPHSIENTMRNLIASDRKDRNWFVVPFDNASCLVNARPLLAPLEVGQLRICGSVLSLDNNSNLARPGTCVNEVALCFEPVVRSVVPVVEGSFVGFDSLRVS